MPLMHLRPVPRDASWSWWRIGPLDRAWAWTIVLVCLGLCVQRIPPLLGKLTLLEPLLNLRSQTGPSVEALALTGHLDALPAMEAQQPARFQVRFEQGQAVASGLKRDGQTEFRLGMRLAVQEPGLAWHALPLCGMRDAPQGWRNTTQPLATGLTDSELPWICSRR